MARDFGVSIRSRHLKQRARRLLGQKAKNPFFYVSLLLFCFIALPFIFITVITKDLPTPDNITKNMRYSSSVLDRNGKVIYQIYNDKNIIPVSVRNIPQPLINATISIEDKDFYKHKGFSLWGIFRSLIRNIIFRRIEGGGSTLTQQLIKNSLLSTEQTMIRKIKELILAVELERRYTKNQILEMYLNLTPYGGTAWGVESAAQYYFGKHVSELNLVESAILAGLPQSPTRYSPFIGEKTAYLIRTKQVLRRMREDRYLTQDQETQAIVKLQQIHFDRKKANFSAPHFIFYIKDQLDRELANNSLYHKGLIIRSTLDLQLQREIEKIVKDEIKNTQGLNINNAAVIVIDPKTGDLLAMVGSVDFNNEEFGKFNASLGLRQPGSALKPFTYAVALQNGYTPSTLIMDTQTEFTSGQPGEKPYIPENYDGKFRGPVQLRMALGSSINVTAVKTLSRIGIKTLLQSLYESGLSTLAPTDNNLNKFGLSLTLGGGEVRLLDLVSAYSTFANMGNNTSVKSINEVRDYRNKLIYKAKKAQHNQVFSKEVAFLISHILSDNNARLLSFGENNYLNIAGYTVAAKTGTTDDKRDNWTVGYTNDLVVGVWVGNNDNSPMNKSLVSGVSGAAPIWRRIFLTAFDLGYSDGIMKKPSQVNAFEVDALFGGLPHEGQPTRSEYFIAGSEPKSVSPFYQKLKISKSTGKIANSAELASGNYDEKEYFVAIEEDPLSTDGTNRWQQGIDRWAESQPDERWKPPREKSDANLDDFSLQVIEPKDNQRYSSNEIRLYAKAVSNYSLKFFDVYVNDELKIHIQDQIIDQTLHFNDGVFNLTFKSENEKGKTAEIKLTLGVNQDVVPTPTPISPTVLPSAAPTD